MRDNDRRPVRVRDLYPPPGGLPPEREEELENGRNAFPGLLVCLLLGCAMWAVFFWWACGGEG